MHIREHLGEFLDFTDKGISLGCKSVDVRDVFFRDYFAALLVLLDGVGDAFGNPYGGITLLSNDFIASHNSWVDTMANSLILNTIVSFVSIAQILIDLKINKLLKKQFTIDLTF